MSKELILFLSASISEFFSFSIGLIAGSDFVLLLPSPSSTGSRCTMLSLLKHMACVFASDCRASTLVNIISKLIFMLSNKPQHLKTTTGIISTPGKVSSAAFVEPACLYTSIPVIPIGARRYLSIWSFIRIIIKGLPTHVGL